MRGAGHALGAIAGENIYVLFSFVKHMLNSNMYYVVTQRIT